MTRAYILILLTVLACKGKQRSSWFTGTIGYTYSYSSDSLNADSLAALRPSRAEFRYDLNDYQNRVIGKDTNTYYYSGARNKCLGKESGQQDYSCEDYSQATDSVISWKIYDTTEKVLGYSCRILEIRKAHSWVRYHVSTDLRIAPATYQKHRSYDWDLYGEKAGGGLILRSEHRFKLFIMKGEATAVNRENGTFRALEIDDQLFSQVCK